ncbi:AAA family ATPase [Roseospira marina]|nr:ATP-binding protein [Roseospira marina]MBB4315454.1 hypothetical protein [Roseospira marina]MBB5088400.1 hypothetical protein [Roseospira marina]
MDGGVIVAETTEAEGETIGESTGVVVLESTDLFKKIDDRGVVYFDLAGRYMNGVVRRALNETMSSRRINEYELRFPIDLLAKHVKTIENEIADVEFTNPEYRKHAASFVGALKVFEKELKERQNQRFERGEIENDDMHAFFEKGCEVWYVQKGKRVGGIVEDVEFTEGWLLRYWTLKLRVLAAINGKIEEATTDFVVPAFDRMLISDLRLHKIDPETKAMLQTRGEKFATFCEGAVYAAYTGNLVRSSYFADRSYRATGRVMIDVRSFRQMEPDGWRNELRALDVETIESDSNTDAVGIDTSEYWRCLPTLHGFSFACKQWGRLDIDDLREIKFREDAYDKLVLDEQDKKLIEVLVRNGQTGFEDVIESKGGGTIFLLHGEPGRGKTLTAEAVSELLRRPLYTISVGELGTDPRALEVSLREILDVAMTWNAVILLDEADIFLEERDEKDIVRNAMVGVFLRLLEYHQGVMFLTTNRVRNIDRAFYSRVSLAIRFGAIDNEWRKRVWGNLLLAAGLDHIDPDVLAHYDLNGRQIKSAIRHAQALARSEDIEPTIRHIERFVERARRFEQDIQNS